MEYTKLSCSLQPDSELNREYLIAELGVIGFESFVETDLKIEAFIRTVDFSQNAIVHLFPKDFTLFRFNWTNEMIADQNWNEVWEKNYFQPLMIADRCLIRAPFHTEYPKAEYEIVIEPGMAFGTGNHETTSLMIEEILTEDLTGKLVLDMGCGTGILSILASMNGAQSVTGIDIDSWAVNSTIENAALNKISNMEIILGGADAIPNRKFDYIYANIQRNILLNDMPLYCRVLKSGGELIMSGFYIDDLKPIRERAGELGLIFKKCAENEKWIAAVFTSK